VISVCFVCLGNICRSPTAEGVFRHLVDEAKLGHAFEIDSAGTAGYHSGEPPDSRARAAGKRAGIPIGGRGRQFKAADFSRFDYVIAMDAANLAELQALAPSAEVAHKLRLLRSFDPAAPVGAAIPDPYYGSERDFDEVLELCRTSCRQLLAEIRAQHGL
jgi:protein-tyrosine phosphatase